MKTKLLNKTLMLFMTFSLLAFKTYGQAVVLLDFEDGLTHAGTGSPQVTVMTTNPDPSGGVYYAHAQWPYFDPDDYLLHYFWEGVIPNNLSVNLAAMENPLLTFDYNTGDNKGFMTIWILENGTYKELPIGYLHSSEWKQMVVPLKEYFPPVGDNTPIQWDKVTLIIPYFIPWLLYEGCTYEVNIDNVFLKAESQVLFNFEDGVKPQDLPEFTIDTISPDTTGGTSYLKVAKSGIAQWTWIGAAEKQFTKTNLRVYNRPLVSFLYNTGAKKGYLQVEVGDNANMKWGYSVGQLESATWKSMEVSLFDAAFSNWATDPLDWSKVKYIKIGFTTGDLTAGSDYEVSIDNIKLKESPRNYEPLLKDFAIMGNVNEDLQFTAELFNSKFSDPDHDTLVKIKFIALPDPKSGMIMLNAVPVSANQEIGVADIGKLKFVPFKDWFGTSRMEWTASDGENYPDEALLDITISHFANLALNKPVDVSSYNPYFWDVETYIKEYANDGLIISGWQGKGIGTSTQDGKYLYDAWINIDLGVPSEISSVEIRWGSVWAMKYNIEVSDDAVTWSTVNALDNGNGGLDLISFDPVTARFVRIDTLIGNSQQLPYINEIEVYSQMSLSTSFPVENIVVGKVDDTEDYSGFANVSWDNDSVYMFFEIKDDSIVTTGNAWQVDNIEIYLDMDNSKRIHWPRNGPWMSGDTTFDDNDHQLRLVPGIPWATNNSLAGVNHVYKQMANGYVFNLNIPWASLMPGFVPEVGKEIGFDVLVSDNDATASDANRNQITWNAPTEYPFNDPSIWGTLQLAKDGILVPIPDKERPTVPTNLTATVDGTNVILTWDPATDNTVVQYYVVYVNYKIVDTVLAKNTGNTYTYTELPAGEYTLRVLAYDIYDHKSNYATFGPLPGIIDEFSETLMIYPNPADNVIRLNNIILVETVVEIFNINGQLMLTRRMEKGDSEINISGLPKGMYTVRIRNSDKVYVSRLVKL